MKRTGKLLALGMSLVMLFSLAGCKTKVKEYDKDSFVAVMTDKLGIPDSDIYSARNEGDNEHPAADVYTTVYKNARINAYFCDDAKAAKKEFDDMWSDFDASFNQHDQFNGNFIGSNTEDDFGYIVINGDNSEVSIFGSIFATGHMHAGLYYSGSMLVMIMPAQMDGTTDEVTDVISALGFPDAAAK